MRDKFRRVKERCFPSLKFEYCAIEDAIISTPGWPPIGGDPITAIYRDAANSSDSSPTELEKMLPSSSDLNNCNSSTNCSLVSVGFTPRTNETLVSSIVSVPNDSASDLFEGARLSSASVQEAAQLDMTCHKDDCPLIPVDLSETTEHVQNARQAAEDATR